MNFSQFLTFYQELRKRYKEKKKISSTISNKKSYRFVFFDIQSYFTKYMIYKYPPVRSLLQDVLNIVKYEKLTQKRGEKVKFIVFYRYTPSHPFTLPETTYKNFYAFPLRGMGFFNYMDKYTFQFNSNIQIDKGGKEGLSSKIRLETLLSYLNLEYSIISLLSSHPELDIKITVYTQSKLLLSLARFPEITVIYNNFEYKSYRDLLNFILSSLGISNELKELTYTSLSFLKNKEKQEVIKSL